MKFGKENHLMFEPHKDFLLSMKKDFGHQLVDFNENITDQLTA